MKRLYTVVAFSFFAILGYGLLTQGSGLSEIDAIMELRTLGGNVRTEEGKMAVVSFYETDITDDGLQYLSGRTNLHRVILSRTKITDAGLLHLKGLTNLKTLGLDSTKITDAGLERLKGLTNLQKLWLRGSKISDDGLKHLEGLTNLKELDLRSTKVTDEGIKQLQTALPQCDIRH